MAYGASFERGWAHMGLQKDQASVARISKRPQLAKCRSGLAGMTPASNDKRDGGG